MLSVAIGAGKGGDLRLLGIAIIGGAVTLTLRVIPTIYEVLADARDWTAARFRRRMPPV